MSEEAGDPEEYLGDIHADESSTDRSSLDRALAVLAHDVEHVNDQVKGLRNHQHTTDTNLAELSEAMTKAIADLKEQAESGPARPLVWTQVPRAEFTQWLADRSRWVNSVLMVDHEEAAHRLPACWPLHPTLVNRLSVCEELHTLGMAGGVLHTALDFLRTLELTLEFAQHLTRACPAPPHPHRPPSIPEETVRASEQNTALMSAYTLYQQGRALMAEGDTAGAEVQRDQVLEILRAAGVHPQVWQVFLNGQVPQG